MGVKYFAFIFILNLATLDRFPGILKENVDNSLTRNTVAFPLDLKVLDITRKTITVG